MNNKQILDNAPAGATHWDKLQYYRIRFNDSSLHVAWDVFNQGSGKWNSVGDMYLTDVYKIRSLADIKEIEQLKGQLATAKADGIRECIASIKPAKPYSPDDISEGYNGYCEAVFEMQEYANQLNKEQGE